ncbi:MAG: c-type cytochrome [Chloroflexi bacterium]|nr:c-type cytochrome [Chloroflexota bacterium]
MTNRSTTAFIGILAALTLFTVVACSDNSESPFSTTTPVPTRDSSVLAGNGGGSAPENSGPDIANGESKFKSLGCSACHKTDTTKLVGPGLAGINAKGDDYISESIKDPAAVLTDGFANLMPTTFASLPESDIEDLIAYLKSLG